jgi:peptide deformylase
MKLTRRVLHNRAKPVTFQFPVANLDLANRMLKFMQQEQGIGLAAPQIGMSQRLFVMQIDDEEYCCFNPEILEVSQNTVEYNEGCLSFRGDQCIIKRPDRITVRYQNYQGEWQQVELDGLAARCFQHEYDHLDGITMWDRYKEQNAEQS